MRKSRRIVLESLADEVVSDVLAPLRIASGRYTRADLTSPWGIRFAARDVPMFHAVDRGRCVLRVEGEPSPIALAQGDVVLLPHGHGHALTDVPERRAHLVDFEDGKRLIEAPDRPGAERARFVCAEVAVDAFASRSLLASLPPVLVIRAGVGGALASLLSALAEEAGARMPGSHEMLRRLIEVAFLQALRVWLVTSDAPSLGWIRGLRDPHLARALAVMHGAPGQSWTLARIARRAGTSRATLARRFAEIVGQTPLAYLTRLRMERAARQLADDPERSLDDVAASHGYRSVAAFSRAFKRAIGTSPGALRREARTRPASAA
jgi:AraC-like DNA-binding protein